MTWSLILHELVLLACVVCGAGIGLWANRRISARAEDGQIADADLGRLSDTIGFIGGAFGILLGLLLLFSVQHFGDSREAAREEAVAASSLFKSSSPFAAPERDQLRGDLVCLMRSSMTEDWVSGASLDLTGAENTNAWESRVQTDVEGLTYDTDARVGYQYFVIQDSLDMAKARQARLLYSQPDIPFAIWIVIWVCTFVFIGLLAFYLADRRWLVRISIIATYIVLLVTIGTLTALDEPFTGVAATVEPVAMAGALTRLQDAAPGAIWDPCPQLAMSVID